MTLKDVMTQVSAFSSEAIARDYQNRQQGRWIVLGDNGQYWVTSYRWAKWLERSGYEILD